MFAVGDKVKIVKATLVGTEKFVGQSGTVLELDVGCYKIDVGDGKPYQFWHETRGLELVKPERKKADAIAFEDIQIGDEIVAYSNAYVEMEQRRKGTVATVQNSYVGTKSEVLGWKEDTFYLLNRPKPVVDPDFIADGTYWVKNTRLSVFDRAAYWSVVVKSAKATWTAHVADGSVRQTTGDIFAHLLRVKQGKVSDREFLTEDPKPKGLDALDKTKIYHVPMKSYSTLNYFMKYVDGVWMYGNNSSTPEDCWFSVEVAYLEEAFTEGLTAWEKPVVWVEPTPKPEKLADGFYAVNQYIFHLTNGKAWEKNTNTDRGFYFLEDSWVRNYIKDNGSVPVDYTPTPQDKMVFAGITSEDRFEIDEFTYKVTPKGNVKLRYTDRKVCRDSWSFSAMALDTFIAEIGTTFTKN